MESRLFSEILRRASREDPLEGIEVRLLWGTGDALVNMLPTLSPQERQVVVNIAGSEETAVAIAEEWFRYFAATQKELLARHGNRVRRRLDSASKAFQKLRKLRLHPADFHEWGLSVHAEEAVALKVAIERYAELLDSSPLLERERGRPRKHAKNSLALRVYGHLHSAGVETGPPQKDGPTAQVLDLLLSTDAGDHSRQLGYVRKELRSYRRTRRP